jgi:hypothetical protein
MLRAVTGEADRRAVNVAGSDGLVRERMARVSPAGLEPEADPPVSKALAGWLAAFEAHEVAVMRAVEDPARAADALALDPLMQASRARGMPSAPPVR